MRLRTIGPAGDAVEFPLARLTDHRVAVGGGGIDFAVENRLFCFACFRQFCAVAVHDLRIAREPGVRGLYLTFLIPDLSVLMSSRLDSVRSARALEN
jgi:hypothetical protein